MPGIARGSGFEDGGVVEEPVSLVDVPPTLVDAAGIDVPDAMEGKSTRPLIAGDADGWTDEAFVQPISGAEVGRGIRTEGWIYSVFAPDAGSDDPQPDRYVERYLYDNRADPAQRTNLIGRSAYRDVADDLRERLTERIAAVEGRDPGIERARYYA